MSNIHDSYRRSSYLSIAELSTARIIIASEREKESELDSYCIGYQIIQKLLFPCSYSHKEPKADNK